MNKINNLEQGDVLIFMADDIRYKSIICTSTFKEKSPHNFTFLGTTVNAGLKPTLDYIVDSDFFGIANRKAEYFKYSDKEIRKMWDIHPEIEPYHLGTFGFIIWRKDFMKFRDNVELIGRINIIDNLDNKGNGSVNASSWEFIQEFFNENMEKMLSQRGQKTYSLKAILR